jgi:hypothetical protein
VPAQKSSSSENTCSCLRVAPRLVVLCITPARWYSPTRRSKKLVLPLQGEEGSAGRHTGQQRGRQMGQVC